MSNPNPSAIDWPMALEQNRSWLTRVLRARIRDSHDVDDVYQELVLSVLKQADRINPEVDLHRPGPTVPTDQEKIAPWLYRLAVRHVVNFYRHTNRQTHARPAADLEPCSPAPQPLDWMLAIEQQQDLNRALDQLSPQDREILDLKYSENWTYQQLADHLGVPVRNIEYRLMNARKRLRTTLSSNHSADTIRPVSTTLN